MNEQAKKTLIIVVAVVAVVAAAFSAFKFMGPEKEEVIGTLPMSGKEGEMGPNTGGGVTPPMETRDSMAGK